eukprot:CAMPEP_0171864168 /NCGR_PEP_ID=MMETSP0992-20121227/28697_1 /TAXON_ID=483369 /ORGANISM="non described non described, Strain CCMP2098" /LENGTH=230 /DNA_ID=CAMNT_0012486689 /DNA_START=37 /DNA_END=726 /DNA_ORIENTATION=+
MDDDPVARARAIAARLMGGVPAAAEPAKKRSRWGADAPASTPDALAGAMVAVNPVPAANPSGSAQSAVMAAMAMAMGGRGVATSAATTPTAGSASKLSASAAVAAAMMVGMRGPKEKKKIYIPTGAEFGDIDFRKLIIGPRGMTQKAMEEKFGCKIVIRGRGSQKDGGFGMGTEDDMDDLHVCVEGDAASVENAYNELARIMSSPEEAQRLKTEQLASLAAMNGGGGAGG